MAKNIQWTRNLGEVLDRQTKMKTFKSKKGKDYDTECIPRLDVITIGYPIEKKDESGAVVGYSYEVYDSKTDASFHITAPQLLDGPGFKKVVFIDVRGGALQSRPEGWFSASRVAPLKES